MIDQLGATFNQGIATSEHGTIGLSGATTMPDGVQQLGIDPGQASQSLRIQLVVLVPAAVDQADVPRIGRDRLVPELLQ